MSKCSPPAFLCLLSTMLLVYVNGDLCFSMPPDSTTPAVSAAPPTADSLITELDQILTIRSEKPLARGSEELRLVQKSREEQLTSWFETLESSHIELGKESYRKSFAIYLKNKLTNGPLSPATEAVDSMTDYVITFGELPESAGAYTGWIDRLMPQVIYKIARSEDFQPHHYTNALLSWARYGGRSPYTAFSTLGKSLMESDTPFALGYRLITIRLLLDNDQLSETEKEMALSYIYSTGEAGGVSFVSFSGPQLGGGTLDLASYKGKVVVVDYWATWCGPCLAEMPNVVAIHDEFKDQDFSIVGVCLDSEGAEERIQEVMTKFNMTWPQIYDGAGTSSHPAIVNNVYGIPMTFVIDRQGKARYSDLRGDELRKVVGDLLKEQTAVER